VLFQKLQTPGEPFDIAWRIGYNADYGDPYGVLNNLFKANRASYNSPKYNRLLDRASRLSGPKRYQTYGNLDIALARKAAPLIAYGTDNVWTFVSKRVGCKILRPELDLAAVCLKR
jgi:ABC-type oligopeptide transport system substrate-binding subunit